MWWGGKGVWVERREMWAVLVMSCLRYQALPVIHIRVPGESGNEANATWYKWIIQLAALYISQRPPPYLQTE